jgi:hypothetical protein
MQRGAWMVVAAGFAVVAAIVAAIVVAGGTGSQGPTPSVQTRPEDGGTAQGPNVAEEREAQSVLRNALVAAKTHYTDATSYEGFTPRLAASIEPSVDFRGDEPATPGTVTINLATEDDLVLSTVAAGQVFCISEHDEGPGAGTYYGRVDGYRATSASDCAGGW